VPHNFHVHLNGRKHWHLFSPRQSSRLYPRGLFSGLPNFAWADPDQPDYARFPRLRGASGFSCVCGPGDTLFIPRGWWHHTRLLDDCVSMNFWWGGNLVYAASRVSTAFKRMRGIQRGEWA
jgi:ribosomal protein L16 Arg81 hydroxylase